MNYYLLPLVYFYLMFGVGKYLRRPNAYIVIGALPMIVLALLRGTVGVDTPNYQNAIDLLREQGTALHMFEPLFEQILLWLICLPVNTMTVLALITLATTIILFVAWLRLELHPLIFTVVIAQFYVDMTMNGIRYGLAFSIISLAAVMLVSGRKLRFWALVVIASLIHLTSGLLGILLYIVHELRWRALAYAIPFVFLVVVSFSDYVLFKIVANEGLQKPEAFSGLAPLGLTWCLLLAWISDRGIRRYALGKLLLLLLLSLLTYGIAQLTFAGLRLQLLVVFLTCLLLACHQRHYGMEITRRTTIIILLIGILFGALKLRNFAQTDESSDAPFVPYKFYWESS